MPTDNDRRKAALKWLSIVRQATIDPQTAAAYLLGLEDLPADVVEQACQDFGRRERESEYEKSWPELRDLRSRCEAIMRVRRERTESRRLLAEPRPAISQERMAEILSQCKQAVAKKVF